MHLFFADVASLITETLIPVRCAVCRREFAEALCPECVAGFAPARLACVMCGKPNLAGITHVTCMTRTAPLQAFSAYDYHDPNVAQSIITGKYNLVADVFTCIAPTLGAACATHCIRPTRSVVCPIPLHARRLTWRGFNQAEILARAIAQALTLPLTPLLLRTRYTKQQKNLRATEREKNVQHCFAIDHTYASTLQNAHVLLVDDVYTIGHTLHAAAQALHEAGVAGVSFITLAKE